MKFVQVVIVLLLALLLVTSALRSFKSNSDDSESESLIQWVWKGAVTHDSLVLKVRMRPDLHPDDARLEDIYATVTTISSSMGDRTMNFVSRKHESTSQVLTFHLSPLPMSNTTYNLDLVMAGGKINLYQTEFKTLPTVGADANFTIAFSSCMDANENYTQIFRAIESHSPEMFLHLGDLHYENIVQNDTNVYVAAYDKALKSYLGQEMLQMHVPTIYMYDDHDFGPDNSDREAPGRESALSTYRQLVPHFSLSNDGVYQSFGIGRVYIMLTDLRSDRTPNSADDSADKSVLGRRQKEWFKKTILEVVKSGLFDAIVWANTMPWIDEERKWGSFKTEQMELAQFLQSLEIKVVIVSGDAHMLAVDDGRNSPGNIPVFHAAALARPGSIKGGPYSHGAFPGTYQYGTLDIYHPPASDDLCFVYTAYRMNYYNNGSDVIQSLNLCTNESTNDSSYVPPPIFVRKAQRYWKKWKSRLENRDAFAITVTILLVVMVKLCFGMVISPVIDRIMLENDDSAAKKTKQS